MSRIALIELSSGWCDGGRIGPTDAEEAQMPDTYVPTRMEIADWLHAGFDVSPRSGPELADLARDRGAPDHLVACLEGLPRRHYAHLRELWEVMPEIPIGE